MPRIRTIKPEFFHDERLADLPALTRLVYIGLWCYCDREGRLENRPRYLASQILPYEARAFDPALAALTQGGWVVPYAVNGKRYLHLPKFNRHQRPHHTEAASEHPAPAPLEHGEITVSSPLEHGEAPDGREGKGREGSGKGKEESRLASTPSPTALQQLWNDHSPPLHHLSALSPSRLRHARARLQEHPDLEYWRRVIEGLLASDFCQGKNDRGWRAGWDWLMRPDVAERILEGRYANKLTPQQEARVEREDWQCPHDPHCGSYWGCQRRVELDSARTEGGAS